MHAARAVHFFFGRREALKSGIALGDRIARLEGITVVLSHDGKRILTAYRNREALKRIKRKPKRGWSTRSAA